MMNNDNQNFVIDWQVERRLGSSHVFCQVSCNFDELTIGNPDEWSLVSLMTGAISDMTHRLRCQTSLEKKSLEYLARLSTDDLFVSLYSWQWGDGNWIYQKDCPLPDFIVDNFYALPIGTEVFDGENAYLVFIPGQLSRFVWRDYESKKINEQLLDFDAYLNKWESVRTDLEAAIA